MDAFLLNLYMHGNDLQFLKQRDFFGFADDENFSL